MDIVINGRFLTQNITGVQRVAREILVEIDRMAAAGEIAVPRLVVPASASIIEPPNLEAMKLESIGAGQGHFWEQISLPLIAKKSVLLCLGNTAPILSLKRKKSPVVVMVHDLSYKYFPNAYSKTFKILYSFIIPEVLKKADKVVTVSKAEQTAISNCYPFIAGSERFSYLQNGGVADYIAEDAIDEELPTFSGREYGLYVGSLTKRKNAEGLLSAVVDFLSSYPDMRFVIIGANGASFEHVSYDIPSELADRIEFWGQVNDKEIIYNAYRKAKFLLFPTFYEASPLPPIEAMTFGCPVVASRIPSLEERCGNAATYCDPADVKTIKRAIATVMKENDWVTLSRKSRMWVTRYSWKKQAKGLVKLCKC